MATTTCVRVQVLGPVHVSRSGSGSAPVFLTEPRPLSALLYLALARPRGLHSRDTLIAMLWPEADQAKGRHALRNALHTIRLTLGDDLLVSIGDSLIGVEQSRMQCDALALDAELDAGRYDAVMARYGGELLQGFHVSRAPEFERWLDAERRRYRDAVLDAARRHAEECHARGDLTGAVAIARQAAALAPDHEPTRRRLLALLLESGDNAAAIQCYDDFAQHLKREYETDPAPETRDMLVRARVARRAVADVSERAPRPTHDGEAYVLYVRGHYLFLRAAHGGRTEDLLVSRTLFEQALQRDPDFALAHAGLSNFFAVAAVRNILRPFRANFDRAIELSHRTLALDPQQAIPHVHFAVQAMYLDSRWDVAEQELARVVALDPLYAEGRRLRGIQLSAMGRRADAIAELREAVRLEPQIAFFRYALASALMDVREYDAALVELHRALELDPGYSAARERLIRCRERQGCFADAIAERRRRGEVVTDFETAFDAEGADGYRKARANELRETIQMLGARLGVSPLENASDILNPLQLRLALAHAELGEWNEARAWEEHAAREQPGRRQWFLTHPDLEPLHRRNGGPDRMMGER